MRERFRPLRSAANGRSLHGDPLIPPWWQRRCYALVLVLLTALPLVWPTVPPLVDLPGHMGRYRVQLSVDGSAALAHFYDFHWMLIGNLGVDLLVEPLSRLLGLEPAVKLVVLAIPPLTASGFLLVAREVHGRLPPTAAFALPLAYGYPFQFGFINFALSMALAFLAFGLWLRMGRTGHVSLRAALFVPLSCLIWLCHTFGWGTLGLLVFASELVRHRGDRIGWLQWLWNAGITCLPLVPPIALMLMWRTGGHVGGSTGDWFNWEAKLVWLSSVLRDRWKFWDLASITALLTLLVVARSHRLFRYDKTLAAAALALLLAFILLPRIIFGSAYADMRLAPFMLATAVLAVHPLLTRERMARALALAALAFFVVRIGGNTVSMWLYDRDHNRVLTALDHMPKGARVLSLVGFHCARPWHSARYEHLPSMIIVRKAGFSNDQWAMAGAQLLTVRYAAAEPYAHDPSQMVPLEPCGGEPQPALEHTIAGFPRAAFDYVWIMDVPEARWPSNDPGLMPVWRTDDAVLYRIVSALRIKGQPS